MFKLRSVLKRISTFHHIAFICIWMVYVYYLWLMIVMRKSSWNLADYLITYEDGGFKRRGLSGVMFLAAHDLTGLPLEILVFLFQTLVFGVFSYLVWRKFLKLQGAVYTGLFYLFFSPYVLTFILSNESGIGKKEFLFFILYMLLFKVLRRNSPGLGSMYCFCLLFLVVLLFHEGLFFYLPYFIAAIFLSDEYNGFYKRRFALLLGIVSILVVCLIYFVGGPINQGETIPLLAERGLEMSDDGILNPIWNKFTAFDHYSDTGKSTLFAIVYYFILLLLGCLYFWFIISSFGLFSLRRMLMIWVITFSFSLPLFYLAADWGRWIFIHFTLSAILILNSRYERRIALVSQSTSVLALVFFLLLQVIRVPFMLPESGLSYWFYLADPIRFVLTRTIF